MFHPVKNQTLQGMQIRICTYSSLQGTTCHYTLIRMLGALNFAWTEIIIRYTVFYVTVS